MNYQDVVKDFASRTRRNLEHIERSVQDGEDVYEITQLVNSLLGLLVFPQQRYFNQIPEIPIAELKQSGWPDVKVTGEYEKHKNLRELLRYLRNAIAHFNVEFIGDGNNNLHVIRVWNTNPRNPKKNRTWEAELSFEDLRLIVTKFIDLMIEKDGKQSGEL